MSDSEPRPRPAGPRAAAPRSCGCGCGCAPAELPITPARVLAAVERAERHRAPSAREAHASAPAARGVPAWAVLEQLAIGRRSGTARRVRAELSSLAGAGLLSRERRRGIELLALSSDGRRELAHARAQREDLRLPESPQHRAWRGARTLAAQEIARVRGRLHELLVLAQARLAAEPPPASDEWFELAEELHAAARRVGSASHCLHEWPEPDDRRADVDRLRERGDERLPERRRRRLRALRAGRRNTRLWSDPADGR